MCICHFTKWQMRLFMSNRTIVVLITCGMISEAGDLIEVVVWMGDMCKSPTGNVRYSNVLLFIKYYCNMRWLIRFGCETILHE